MNKELSNLVARLNNSSLPESSVIPWGSPVPSFGNLLSSRIATIGLNPSNREFVDVDGKELDGINRRFHTLKSLGINEWSEATENHLQLISKSCKEYFIRNPYNWFKKLDYLISGTAMSYYFPSTDACHLDLVPYATESKWANLSSIQRVNLLDQTGDTLGILLKNSNIKLLILNGQTVVDNFQKISNIQFEKSLIPEWRLSRKNSNGISGYSYSGDIDFLGGIRLKNSIKVLGYNHNIQSSFGVTTKVQTEIRNWITLKSKEVFK